MRTVKAANTLLFEKDDKERLIGEIPRHPIGVTLIIFNTVFLMVIILTGLFYALRHRTAAADSIGIETTANLSPVIIIVAVVLLMLILVGSTVATYVYTRNFLVLTDQKLVIIAQISLFARKVSQLSIGDVQDVTVEQPGLLSRIFNYGTIKIETAGEQANFSFNYAPDPFESAKIIVQAHEENLQLYGN